MAAATVTCRMPLTNLMTICRWPPLRGPVQFTGKRANAVLLPEADWRAIQETL
jgi:hypothetical protein